MQHLVSPFFPEPITVPDNVAEKGYRAVTPFARRVALIHLTTVVGLTGLVAFWLAPVRLQWLSGIDTETIYLLTAASLVLLAALRSAPLLIQVPVFFVFAVSFSAALALWGGFMHDVFPAFVECFMWAFGATVVGLLVYNIVAARDYSLGGAFVIVFLFAVTVVAAYTFLTEVLFSEGVTIALVIGIMLFYWTYDLAMILRRRTADERGKAVLDLYRDVLNFVGYPIRIMRMPRGRRRLRQQW